MHSNRISKKLDHLGVTVSVLCAIHCAVMPIVLTALPFLGLGFLAHPALESGIIVLSLTIGLSAIYRSWHRHRRYLPLLMMLTGFSLIATGHFWVSFHWEWLFLVLGSMAVATAHLLNWRFLHRHLAKLEPTRQK